MAIYAIADLHLSLNTDKPMDVFGPNWKNHYKKIEKNWRIKYTLMVSCMENIDIPTGYHSIVSTMGLWR